MPRLRRELGKLESYAALVGMLVGAGIFSVTSRASNATGPSVILAYLLLAPIVLASAVPYIAFLGSSIGASSGGEYRHIARSFEQPWLSFVCGWLKLISYLGAGAYLAGAFADYVLEAFELEDALHATLRRLVAIAICGLFLVVHLKGVRNFGRVQVWMCALLGLSIVLLVIPGLFAIETDNYRPFFTGEAAGFFSALPLVFFAFAGFESLAQTAGEAQGSGRSLGQVFRRGILGTSLIFLSMSAVAFGVLPAATLAVSQAPMVDVARSYLPFGAEGIVRLGALMAIATSINATLFVPGRLALAMSEDGLLPSALGKIDESSGTPRVGLWLSFLLISALVLVNQVALAVTGAVAALIALYGIHALAYLLLPKLRPELARETDAVLSRRLGAPAALVSVLAMGAMLVTQIRLDIETMRSDGIGARFANENLTASELLLVWAILGAAVFLRRTRRRDRRA